MLIEDAGVATIGSALGAEVAMFQTNLSGATSAHDIRVELASLQKFYDQLWQVEGELQKAMHTTANQAAMTEFQGAVSGIGAALEGAGSVPGVDAAVNAAMKNVSGATDGLGTVLKAMHAIVVQNLQALYDTYMHYLDADHSGAAGLSSAASNEVTGHWQRNQRNLDTTVAGNEIVREVGIVFGVLGHLF